MADLAAQGIEIRKGDYFDYGPLLNAFVGVEKVMLISTLGFTDRNTQHYNVITAARQAGVRHVVYTAIIRREGSDFILPECTHPDLFCEQTLKALGLTYTIVREPAFLETLQSQIGETGHSGRFGRACVRSVHASVADLTTDIANQRVVPITDIAEPKRPAARLTR